MITKLAELETLLAYFETAPAPDRAAAAGLCKRFAKRAEFAEYTAEQQHRALAIAASRRTPQDLQLLDDLAAYSTHERIRKAAAEERNPATSLYGGTGRRQMMPESLVR